MKAAPPLAPDVGTGLGITAKLREAHGAAITMRKVISPGNSCVGQAFVCGEDNARIGVGPALNRYAGSFQRTNGGLFQKLHFQKPGFSSCDLLSAGRGC